MPIYMQKKIGVLRPYAADDRLKLSDYLDNQILEIKIKDLTPKKVRSIRQLNYYWLMCGKVAENARDNEWNHKDKVDFNCRVEARLYATDKNGDVIVKVIDGNPQFSYRSIAIENMKHIEACNYFDTAFNIMADYLGCTVDELKGSVYDIS